MEIVVAIIGSGALSAFISGLFTLAQKRSQNRNGVRSGVRLLLEQTIRERCERHIADGFIGTDELDCLCREWSCYHKELDGNGFLDSLMKRVKELPLG